MTKIKAATNGKRSRRPTSTSPVPPPASKQSDDFEHDEIHRRFMEMCAEDGLTQADAARFGEASTSTANAWWAGRLPDPIRLSRICRKLKWNAHQILTGDGPKRAFSREELAAASAMPGDGGVSVAHIVLREIQNAVRIVGSNYGFPADDEGARAGTALPPAHRPGVSPRL